MEIETNRVVQCIQVFLWDMFFPNIQSVVFQIQ